MSMQIKIITFCGIEYKTNESRVAHKVKLILLNRFQLI